MSVQSPDIPATPVEDLSGVVLGGRRLVARLGEGGMGSVWLGEGIADRAAVKVVHPHLMKRPAFLERFRREADAGRRVRHRNVAATLDEGTADVAGSPRAWLAVELVEGQSLREALAALGPFPDALLREVGRQLAAGLAALHAAGIVHRDLKPANVLLARDDRVAIVDLGVAKVSERTTITRDGEFMGSLLHAAPEQFKGDGVVGPPADLYAAGVVLYEMATGENPFRSDEVPAVVHAHLHEVPPPAEDRSPGVSHFVSEVLSTLLEKDPARRFSSAAALETVFAEGEASAWWKERATSRRPRAAAVPRIYVRRETALYGRDTELAALRDAWERAGRGEGSALLLEGEAGIGKTRLVDAFVASLGGTDAHVLYGSFPPTGGSSALAEAVLARFGGAHLEETLAPWLVEAPSLVAGFAAVLRHEAPRAGTERPTAEAVQAVHLHLARALAADRPTVWVVDDLHFAGPEARRTAVALARAAEGRRLLVVLTARPGLPAGEVESLARLSGFRRVPVGRLSPREVVRLLRDALGSETLADRLGARIAFKSDGVPFFVFEMLKTLKESGALGGAGEAPFATSRILEAIEVPSAVRDLVRARCADLAPDARSIVDCGAVDGFEFDPDLVARALEMPRLHVLRVLAELERRTGIVRSLPGVCRFDHHQVVEVLYQEMPPDLKAEYHALLAEACERRAADRGGAPPSGAEATRLAWHALHGCRPAKGLPVLRLAVSHLAESGREEDAVRLVERALTLGSALDDDRRVDLLLERANLLQPLGRFDETAAAAAAAAAEAERLGDRSRLSRAFYIQGELHREQGRYDEARTAFLCSAQLAVDCGNPRREVEARIGLGNLAHSIGMLDESIAAYHEAVAAADRAGQPYLQGLAGGSLARSLSLAGRHEEARGHLERSARRLRECGSLRSEDVALSILAIVLHKLGRLEESLRLHERDLARARETGAIVRESMTEGNLGALLMDLGRFEEARAHHERKLAMSRELGLRVGVGFGHHQLGRVAEVMFEPARAEASYLAAAEEFTAMKASGFAVSALIDFGRFLLGMGRPDEARARFEEALTITASTRQAGAAALASGYLALLGVGDVKRLRAGLAAVPPAFAESERLEALRVLWKATGDARALAEARRAAQGLLDAAPAVDRPAMREKLPLLREVLTG